MNAIFNLSIRSFQVMSYNSLYSLFTRSIFNCMRTITYSIASKTTRLFSLKTTPNNNFDEVMSMYRFRIRTAIISYTRITLLYSFLNLSIPYIISRRIISNSKRSLYFNSLIRLGYVNGIYYYKLLSSCILTNVRYNSDGYYIENVINDSVSNIS